MNDDVKQHHVLFPRPGSLDEPGLETLVVAVEALHVGAVVAGVLHALADLFPLLVLVLLHELLEHLVLGL